MKTLLPISLLLPVALYASISKDIGLSREGIISHEYTVSPDSVVDLSDISRYGRPMEWRLASGENGDIVEAFGDRWIRYEACGDTIFITHRENARERSDFRIPIMPVPGGTAESGYLARSRRDMSFMYADSGTVSLRRFVTPILILADGDTVRGCPAEERVFRYDRQSLETLEVVGKICDTETVWRTPEGSEPLASSFTRHVSTEKVEGITESAVCVFPQDLHVPKITRHYDKTREMKASESGMNIADGEPCISYESRRIEISSPVLFDFALYDASGRVAASGKAAVETAVLNLSGLPGGEYVIYVEWERGHTSRAILVK